VILIHFGSYKNGKNYYIDSSGNFVDPPRSDAILIPKKPSEELIQFKKRNKYGYLLKPGREMEMLSLIR